MSEKEDFTQIGSSLRLLFVEDNPRDVKLTASVLERSGYRLTFDVADSPASFEKQLARGDHEIIICDYNLRDWTAIDALEIVKKSGKDIPVVVVSGSLGDQAVVDLIKLGATDYILKDRMARLPSAIQRALEENKLREERQAAEEALRRSEANYRSLVECAPYGIYRATAEGKLLSVNPALVEMLGYNSEDELLGVNLDAGAYLDEAERIRPVEPGGGVKQFRGVEAKWKRKDGKIIIVRRSGRPVYDGQGGFLYVEVMAEDVTEVKLLEEQFRQAQKMEAVGKLAGGVAHDFNNLLGVILGYSGAVLEKLSTTDPLRKKVENIEKAAEKAVSVTRQLLAFSRQQVLQPKVLDLNAVVVEMEDMLRRLIGEDIELAIATDTQLGRVKADPTQIEQVIMNLAVNARDAMPQGGKLTIETANVQLDSSYARRRYPVQPGPHVMLAVSDTGTGMDAETQARIFEPFFTTKGLGKGTGLGLATVYGIVKQSGGYIWVYSEPGRGATFKIYLPRAEEAVLAEKRPKAAVASLRGSETILLVEDEESLRKLTRELLEDRGYAVLEAGNGAKALEIAARHQGPIHLVITDVVMPGISGREVAQRMEALRPDAKVLYMSGYTADAITRHGVLEPGMAFLQKPIRPEELAQKVREVLNTPRDAVSPRSSSPDEENPGSEN